MSHFCVTQLVGLSCQDDRSPVDAKCRPIRYQYSVPLPNGALSESALPKDTRSLRLYSTMVKLTDSSCSSRATRLRSFGSISVSETPFFPARAVRPLRCV